MTEDKKQEYKEAIDLVNKSLEYLDSFNTTLNDKEDTYIVLNMNYGNMSYPFCGEFIDISEVEKKEKKIKSLLLNIGDLIGDMMIVKFLYSNKWFHLSNEFMF